MEGDKGRKESGGGGWGVCERTFASIIHEGKFWRGQ